MRKFISVLYKIGFPIAKAYWFLRRPTTEGVKCIILNENKTLLIKHAYGPNWFTAVGGGIKAGENYEQAMIREIKEEVNLTMKDVTKIGEIYTEHEYKRDTIHVFLAHSETQQLKISSAEISEARWCLVSDLPKNTSPLFKRFFELARPYF